MYCFWMVLEGNKADLCYLYVFYTDTHTTHTHCYLQNCFCEKSSLRFGFHMLHIYSQQIIRYLIIWSMFVFSVWYFNNSLMTYVIENIKCIEAPLMKISASNLAQEYAWRANFHCCTNCRVGCAFDLSLFQCTKNITRMAVETDRPSATIISTAFYCNIHPSGIYS